MTGLELCADPKEEVDDRDRIDVGIELLRIRRFDGTTVDTLEERIDLLSTEVPAPSELFVVVLSLELILVSCLLTQIGCLFTQIS